MVGLGIVTILLGLIALGAPLMTSAYLTMMVGAFLLVSGVFQIVHGFGAAGWKGKMFAILIGVLAVIGGAMLMSRPMIGIGVFTLFLAGYFLADGIVSIAMAFKLKPEKGWGWVLFSGIVTLMLGIVIWRQWPISGIWAIGILFVLMAGWSMVIFGSVARGIAKAAEEGNPA